MQSKGLAIHKETIRSKNMKELNKHDFEHSALTGVSFKTFSIGVFKWIPAKTGLKKSKSIVRVKGPSSDPEKVYAKAKEICQQLDQEVYNGPKTVTV